jgi:hypothetical protein
VVPRRKLSDFGKKPVDQPIRGGGAVQHLFCRHFTKVLGVKSDPFKLVDSESATPPPDGLGGHFRVKLTGKHTAGGHRLGSHIVTGDGMEVRWHGEHVAVPLKPLSCDDLWQRRARHIVPSNFWLVRWSYSSTEDM